MRFGPILTTLFVLASVLPALSQQKHQMSAREVFYLAPKVKAKKPVASAAVAKPAPTPAPVPVPSPPEPIQTAVTQPPAPPAPPPTPDPAPAPVWQETRPAPNPGEGQFIAAKLEDLPQLGLRCSVLKRVGPSDLVEVSPDTTFRSGDRIRLRVEANDDGYLYVILRGSSGIWKPLFPSPEVDGGNNRVPGGRPYEIPAGHVFTFDDQAGTERLFVVLSRQPVEDLDGMIYKLGQGQPAAPATAAPATPAAPPVSKPVSKDKLMLAQNLVSIEDTFVDRLRTAYARDLIIEKVDDSTTDQTYGKENAVYAVTGEAKEDSRVVVDLQLVHR